MQTLGEEDKPVEYFSLQKQPKQEQQEKWIHARSQKYTVALSVPNSLVQSFLKKKNCTSLHMMLGHALYARVPSKSLLTTFSGIGVSASFQVDGMSPRPSTYN